MSAQIAHMQMHTFFSAKESNPYLIINTVVVYNV